MACPLVVPNITSPQNSYPDFGDLCTPLFQINCSILVTGHTHIMNNFSIMFNSLRIFEYAQLLDKSPYKEDLGAEYGFSCDARLNFQH
jgi:hypothetical protein